MTSTMTMATATMTMAATATDMASMTTMTTSMDMSKMAMTFFYSHVTPLFSKAWTPATVGQYAATCIFLIVFTVIQRGLVAFHNYIFSRTAPTTLLDKLPAPASNTFNPLKEVARGGLEAVTGGMAYLLMIAVMTMNVGYFASVIAGLFLGGFLFGRFDASYTYC